MDEEFLGEVLGLGFAEAAGADELVQRGPITPA